ncbi:hypothetical protein NDU88_005461 [Pleurodeles waltl]|uniref:Secreted protein n=1 Tax=Pleurodeles waltl TaxID=8319 RepID=A0AAV7RJQ4_PLEWA|nr:hypothetical protein NDU88_005461 [Pleurodeles waltl]
MFGWLLQLQRLYMLNTGSQCQQGPRAGDPAVGTHAPQRGKPPCTRSMQGAAHARCMSLKRIRCELCGLKQCLCPLFRSLRPGGMGPRAHVALSFGPRG